MTKASTSMLTLYMCGQEETTVVLCGKGNESAMRSVGELVAKFCKGLGFEICVEKE
jgi:hypothetical protein